MATKLTGANTASVLRRIQRIRKAMGLGGEQDSEALDLKSPQLDFHSIDDSGDPDFGSLTDGWEHWNDFDDKFDRSWWKVLNWKLIGETAKLFKIGNDEAPNP